MQGFEITEDLLSKEDDQLNARPCVTGIAQFHPKAESNEADCYGNRKSYVCKLYFTYPLKLMVPKYAGSSNTQWLYPITYGGGLVAGDHIDLDVTVGDGCSVLITTQGSTKVYKSVNNLISMQGIDAKVNNGGLLAILPDPVVCYQNARYAQTQSIHQRVDSNIILLDWLTAGRVALGECWQFTSYSSKTSIFIEDQLVFRDSVQLSDKPTCTVKQSMDGYTAIAMCVIIGPQLKQLCDESMERIGKRKSIGHQQERDVMVTVSKLDCNVNNTDIHGIVVRIAAYSTTQAFLQIEKILSSVYPRLGGNPFQNKY